MPVVDPTNVAIAVTAVVVIVAALIVVKIRNPGRRLIDVLRGK